MNEETQPKDVGLEHGQAPETYVPPEASTVEEPRQPPVKATDMNEKELVWECPVCSKSFEKWNSLVGHGLGAHSIRFKKEDFVVEGGRPSPPMRALDVDEEEPLPSALDQLEVILKEFGIKRRKVVLRSMSLRDPTDLESLMWALDDVGVNQDHQRRIITDFAKWVGAKIPFSVIEKLQPRTEEVQPGRWDRWQRDASQRRWGFEGYPYRGREGYPEFQPQRGQDTEGLLKGVAALMREMQPQHPRQDDSQIQMLRHEVEAMRQQNEDLRRDLSDERSRRLEDMIGGLREELSEIKNQSGDVVSQSIKELGDVVKGIWSTAFSLTERPPPRTRGSPGGIVDLMPDEYVERRGVAR